MSTAKRVWGNSGELYRTNLYSGADSDVSITEVSGEAFDLDESNNGWEGVQVMLKYDGANSPDDLIVRVYADVAESTPMDTDLEAISTMIFNGDNSEQIQSFILKDVRRFSLGLEVVGSSGSDTYDVHAYCSPWRWDIS